MRNSNRFNQIANQLNDRDSEWWPFVFLRPDPSERLSRRRCLALALLHVTPAVLLLLVAEALLHAQLGWLALAKLLGVSIALVFVALYCTVALSWNRRALHLQALAERRNRWRHHGIHSKPLQ